MALLDPQAEASSHRITRTKTAVQGIPQLLRSIDVRLELLQARGVPVPSMDMARPYARFLVNEALMLSPAGDGERGFDATDSSDMRYWIVGKRGAREDATVRVPGLPDRCFDCIVAVSFGEGYGIITAGVARAEAFLRQAQYRDATNDWALSLHDEFWSGPRVIDLTVALRTVAAEVMTDDALPLLESFTGPMPYPSRRADADLTPPRA